MKRRDFLGNAALGTGVLLSIPGATFAEQEKKTKPEKPRSTDPVAMVPLTDRVSCSRIGFGCGMRGSNRESDITRMDREKAYGLLRFAYDQGVRFFDMADLYGAHQIVAEALKDKPRDSYVLSSKIWEHRGGLGSDSERPSADVVVERFLKECRTDYLDVVQIHCMMNGNWAKDHEKQMEVLEKLKEKGVIRAHGISAHANAALKTAAQTPWTDVVHVRLNTEGANMEGTVEEVVEIAQSVHKAGIGTIAMKLIGEGKFANHPELRKKSVRFVSKLDCVDVMIAAFDEKEHITELIEHVRAGLEEKYGEKT